MTEKPILFSGPMVRAILAGQKTQTRRVVKPSPGMQSTWLDAAQVARVREGYVTGVPGQQMHRHDGSAIACGWQMLYPGGRGPLGWIRSPYGAPGDRLWVRETWRTATRNGVNGVVYAADGAFAPIADTHEAADAWVDDHGNSKHGLKWRPSIFLHRWACRLVLAVESIRVERLNDISEEDARAEGALVAAMETGLEIGQMWTGNAREAFANLWQSINGKRPGCSWYANPWVWVVTFSRERAP